MINLKSKQEIELIRECGKISAELFNALCDIVKDGITTEKIDKFIGDFLKTRNAEPAFKGYRGFPANSCISIDREVVHGIPSGRIIKKGQIVSIDIGVKKNGYISDSANSYAVGEISFEKKKLIEITKNSLYAGIEKARVGNRVHDISSAVQEMVENAGFSVVRDLTGHGVGREIHEEPEVPNFGVPNTGRRLLEGMVIAIEPMVNMGGYEVQTADNGWTIETIDGQPSAHFEHTVAIVDGDADILTK
ncbi:type I methionyl aminopeptidase [bacterium]|nr:type I methionyl aminopeptidase [bacterium]